MKKKIIIAACITSFLFGGCNYAMQPDDLMAKPEVGIISDNIHSQIQKDMPIGFKLLEDKDAITMLDLDNNNNEEVIVFYRSKTEKLENKVKMRIYNIVDNQLKLIDEITNVGLELSDVKFKDINADGAIEILMKVKQNDSDNVNDVNNHILNIYRYSSTIQRIDSIPLEQYKLIDFNNDGKQELITAYKEDMLFTSIRLYSYKEHGYSKISEESLGDATVKEFVIGNVAEDIMGVYIHSTQGANTSINHLLVYKDGRLYNPIKKDINNNEGKKVYDIDYLINTGKAVDYNKDGILEIPIYSSIEDNLIHSNMGIRWFRWDGIDNIKLTAQGIGNHLYNYHIILPNNLDEKLVYTSNYQNAINEDIYMIREHGADKRIFKIVTVYDKEIASNLDKKYLYLKNYQNNIYFLRIINTDLYKKYFKDYEIKDNFIVGWRK